METLHSTEGRGPSAPAARIVIVDDHTMMRDGLRAVFLREGGALTIVGEAATAREGHLLVQQTRPDLAILDVDLPDQNGILLAGEIRLSWPATKTLLISGSSRDPAFSEAARAGVDGFIRKEDAVDELLRAISALLAGRSYFSPAAALSITRGLWERRGLSASPAGPSLAGREREVLRNLAEGLSYKEIAALMNLSVRTVETYRQRLARKLGASSRAALVRSAVRLRLVEA